MVHWWWQKNLVTEPTLPTTYFPKHFDMSTVIGANRMTKTLILKMLNSLLLRVAIWDVRTIRRTYSFQLTFCRMSCQSNLSPAFKK
jgi:hypothetical protein